MANHHKRTLKFDIKQIVYVKPSKPTPNGNISLSALDNRADNNGLCHIVQIYQSPKNDQNDPALMIKEALSKALFYYYPLAGRIVKHADGKLRVNCNANGVPFVEAIANCNLSSLHYLDGSNTEIAKHLVLDLPSEDEHGFQLYPLLIKVTKFLCGGFTIGLGTSHAIIDGSGKSQFLQAIAEFASGKTEPSVKPAWEREKLVGSITKMPLEIPMDESSAAVSPYLPTKKLVHACFKVDNESIKRLKMSLMKEVISDQNNNMEESFTSFESLASYVWRARTRALKLNSDGKVMLTIIVGIRKDLLDPPLPKGYYGNIAVDANIVLTAREVNERPLSHVAKIIKETKKVAQTKEYVKRMIDTSATAADDDFDYDGRGACMVLTDWKHLGFSKNMDLGWTQPVNFVPAPCGLFDKLHLCIFSSPSSLDPSMDGGARIFVSLPNAAMPKFRNEIEALITKP
ncbi:hypothetical protein HN51_000471 [Arachis hypogaea]|uniref:Uncharacterized protein n=2 Tax=Arachis hypogaea TaxID=3818 RepID=A0A445EVT9_ARAHY|nr:spermidine coumaroyl-CoA acyltransferase [Arachis hypogaea]QHO48390.1 Spermidine coumaroyl CoA acyltransferase [Arachis hypogaea]RYR79531.1 hypothetical protein Ahy_A01g004341 isoform A [Arachis hypogaea]